MFLGKAINWLAISSLINKGRIRYHIVIDILGGRDKKNTFWSRLDQIFVGHIKAGKKH